MAKGKRREAIDRQRRTLSLCIGAGAALGVGGHRSARAASESSGDGVELADLAALASGEPVAFTYPTERDDGFLVKLGRPAEGGVGPDGDVVAFLSACPHMGCPITRIDL